MKPDPTPPVRIGLGATVYHKGLAAGRLDGIGVYTRALRAAYGGKGIDSREYYWGRRSPAGSLREEAAQRISAVPYSISTLYSGLTSLPSFGSRQIEKEIDVFHALDQYIPKLNSVPVVATIMDAIPLVHPEWASANFRKLKNKLYAWSVKWPDHVIAISRSAVSDLVEYLGIPEEKISVVHLGVDEDYFDRVDTEDRLGTLAKYGLKEGFFLSIGTLQPRKNLERIILAHRLLPHDMQREHPLVIAGKNGWGTDKLMPMIARLEQEGTGKWLNYVPRHEAMALMQSATALVFPSLYEGFGLPVLEAFAAGLPVVTSNTTSLPEVAGDAALLVDPESIDALAHAMEQVAMTPGLRLQLRESGLQRAKEMTWGHCAENTLQVYQAVLAGRSGRLP